MIEAAGAYSTVEAMVDHFEVTEAGLGDIIIHTGPFFLRAHRHWMDRPGGVDELNKFVRSGGPQQFADRPELVQASVSRQEGRNYLQYLFLDDQVLGMVTQRIASRLDIDSQKLQEMMPNLATLFVGVLCKSIAQ